MSDVKRPGKLDLIHQKCCVCESDDAIPIGVGRDYEYATSSDEFLAMQCVACGLVYLNPRPSITDLPTIYPENYHAFEFSEEQFGLIHKIRSRLEAKRLLSWCRGLKDDARILDVGCGDGFHIQLLKKFGQPSWNLEGVDIDERAVQGARARGLNVHHGTLASLDLPQDAYDLAIAVQTIEHVEDPQELLVGIYNVLKPGGRLVVVTDNTGSIDFSMFKGSYWGGYHFPRHWNLFNRLSIKRLSEKAGFSSASISTSVSPVNWVYSFHNALVDWRAPQSVVNRFTLKSTLSLSLFTAVDMGLQQVGRGALLRAILIK